MLRATVAAATRRPISEPLLHRTSSGTAAHTSVPEGAFEAAFAIYLIVKGFSPCPVLASASTT